MRLLNSVFGFLMENSPLFKCAEELHNNSAILTEHSVAFKDKIMKEIKLNIDLEQIQKDASLELSQRIRNGFSSIINEFCYDLFSTETLRRKTGIARKLIESQCLDLLQNEEQTKTTIKKYAEENWERILQEAAERALRHKANGLAFKNIRGE